MRALAFCVALACPVLCQDGNCKHIQISPPDGGAGISLTASEIVRHRGNGVYSEVELKGNVEIRTALCGHEVPARRMIVVRADAATYHEGTAEINARGNVRIRFEPIQ